MTSKNSLVKTKSPALNALYSAFPVVKKNLLSVFERQLETVSQAFEEHLIDELEASDLINGINRELVCKDILAWGKYYFPDKFTLPFCQELHRYFIDISDEPFTNTLAPRGHAKTTIKCFLIPLYFALNYPEKYRHYVNVQATSTKAVAVNLSIRYELEENDLLIRDYGDMRSEQKWTEKQFILSNGVIFSALGAGDSVRGINVKNVRPDYLIADDLYDEDDIENPRLIEKKNRWFWGSIYKAMANDRPVSIHIQGTAINKNDLMHLLFKNKRWKSRKFQAIDIEGDVVLWVEANTKEKLAQDKEDMGSIIFEREMQNNLRDDETAIIKQSYIQTIQDIPGTETIVKRVSYVDPAAGVKEHNDYTGKCAVYISDLKNYYIVGLGNDRMTLDENIRDMEAWQKKYKFNEMRFEGIAGFKAMTGEIRRRTDLPIREISAVKDKITRLINQSPKFENHKVFFVSSMLDNSIMTEAIDQLTTNNPPHDDLRDAIVGCLEDSTQEFYMV